MDETSIGGPGHAFPSTCWSRLTLDRLVEIYWKPVYRYIRSRWSRSNEDAKDLTQAFFARFVEDATLARLEEARGSFRGYLRKAIDHFLVDDGRRRGARKRGGAGQRLSLEIAMEDESVSTTVSPEETFDREWARACLTEALRRLRRRLEEKGRLQQFEVFRAYYADATASLLGEPPPPCGGSHGEIARRLNLGIDAVNNHLAHLRRTLREIVLECVSEYSLSPSEAQAELRFVLGG